jgi:N-acetylglucosaminyldiphosphoundecaprenol N-acetyl-beta-D-mannosaminyltransferase
MSMASNFKTVSCLGYNLFADKLDSFSLKQKIEINTINQYSYCIAKKDSEFKNALRNSDILLPDGVGMTWASKFLNGKKIKKIAGADIHQFLLEKMNQDGGSCFYLGASTATLLLIQNRIKKEYPNIRVDSYSPQFKSSFTIEDTLEMIQKVNQFNPNVLFVGMTAPKQEKWSNAHKEQLNANVICSIGAVFDFYAGSVDRPGKIWIDLKLEWLGRLLKEPRRMWRRYIYFGAIFVYNMTKYKLQSKKTFL